LELEKYFAVIKFLHAENFDIESGVEPGKAVLHRSLAWSMSGPCSSFPSCSGDDTEWL
jgi:hypothetical protein